MIRYGAAPEFARSSIVTNRAHVLLWTDSSAAYLDAIKAAGLADRVAVDTLPRKDKPSADQLARTEALMAGAVPAALLALFADFVLGRLERRLGSLRAKA